MAAENKKRGRVLVVDDERCILDALRRILRGEHDVVTTASPTDALERIMGGERYDAILCDLMMPELTGMEMYEALVDCCGDQAKRMVFITGGATRDTHEVFLNTVTLPCLHKPFTVDDVLKVVRKVVG